MNIRPVFLPLRTLATIAPGNQPLPSPKHHSKKTHLVKDSSRTSNTPERRPGRQAKDALSLLRSLLRECSYLPDDHVRRWVKQHVLSSFYANTTVKDEGRLLKKFGDGRQNLSLLRRAAEGDSKALLRVLMMAYGRIGKRRRELLAPLLGRERAEAEDKGWNGVVMDLVLGRGESRVLEGTGLEQAERVSTPLIASPPPNSTMPAPKPPKPTDSAFLGHDLSSAMRAQQPAYPTKLPFLDPGSPAPKPKISAQEPEAKPTRYKFEPEPLPDKLSALLNSQIQHAPPTLTRINPRRINPVIPEENAWLRPMPINRVKNMHKKHYALLLSRALPPLPSDEWQRLRDLASGVLRVEVPRARRKRAGASGLWDEKGKLETVLRHGKVPVGVLEKEREVVMTARKTRRLYAQVFSQCPVMHCDEKKGWKVRWGEEALFAVDFEAVK